MHCPPVDPLIVCVECQREYGELPAQCECGSCTFLRVETDSEAAGFAFKARIVEVEGEE